MYTYIQTYMCMYVCLFVCMYVCLELWQSCKPPISIRCVSVCSVTDSEMESPPAHSKFNSNLIFGGEAIEVSFGL